ncbi:class I SAM-dependent methyltransferase [Limnobaculum zhutongyuii]|uniref:Class I SAM-dependent methyltransferase n=1 Tax=Limnobaculum zhutongyuii TaxID=2498113 RepID=A0A411WJL9_9GAMM|nr:class I SAM-dependent methyltransferase [Limnobaculum zhutongyuii]QBH96367.1 class I SAM-dependent methyltransferase [Limnobaculum zhutongyuii]TQS86663.1 class I SAM-dependent methyltransferase [Limnobaculum zhutongyuii]
MTHPAADKIIELYQTHAKEWDSLRGKSLNEKAWLDKLISILPDSNNATVLDIGCGSGEPIAQYLIEQQIALTGIDSSSSMIEICQRRFPDSQWRVADMRTLSLNQKFDGLIAWDSFFHLNHEDQREMFQIFSAHAKSGSALMFTSGPEHGEAIGRFCGKQLYHSSLSEDEYRHLLNLNGFDVIDHIVEDPECGHHTIWLARHR